MSAKLELFHRVADPACAAVRRKLVELGLEANVSFRNVHFEVHQQALAAIGGAQVPAVWDGQTLCVGSEASISRLEALAKTLASS